MRFRLQPDGHRNLGLTLLRMGRASEAIPALERALELRPDDDLARRALGAAESAGS